MMTNSLICRVLAMALAVMLITSCKVEFKSESKGHVVSHSISYGGPEDRALFKAALIEAKVPHELYLDKDGLEYVRWKPEDNDAVERIKRQLFGEPIEGRSIHFEEPYHKEFKQWLTSRGIPFTTIVNRETGTENVVWETTDYARVAQWEHFPRDYYDKEFGLSSNPIPGINE